MVNIIEFVLFLMESKSQYSSMQSTGSWILHGSSVIRKEYNCAWERNWGQTVAETLKGSTSIEESHLCLCRTWKFSNSKKLKLCYFCGHFCHWYSFCSVSFYIKLVEVYEVFFPLPLATKLILWRGIWDFRKGTLLEGKHWLKKMFPLSSRRDEELWK